MKSSPQTQQRSNHNGQEVVWESSHPLSSCLPSSDLLLMCPPSFVNDPVVAHFSCGPFLDQSLVLQLWGSHTLCRPPPYALVAFTPDVSPSVKDTEFASLSCGPFPDQLLVLGLWDEDGGHHPIPGEVSPLYGSLLPDLYSEKLGK